MKSQNLNILILKCHDDSPFNPKAPDFKCAQDYEIEQYLSDMDVRLGSVTNVVDLAIREGVPTVLI